MKMNKWKLLAVSYFVIIVTLLYQLSFMYYKTSSELSHIVNQGEIAMKVVEQDVKRQTNEEETKPDEGIYILPGSVLNKVFYVENIGSEPFWVRTRIAVSADDRSLSPDVLDFNFNLEDWIPGEDGYYYYRYTVLPGERSANLYSDIRIAGSADTRYLDSVLTVKVYIGAVQSASINADNVLQVRGWPADVE